MTAEEQRLVSEAYMIARQTSAEWADTRRIANLLARAIDYSYVDPPRDFGVLRRTVWGLP